MTAPQEEWTDWFLHDGNGCPCVGQYVQVEALGRDPNKIIEAEGIAGLGGAHSWDWTMHCKPYDKLIVAKIIRFRIRKLRALLDMIQLIADLPAPVAPIKTDGVIA